MNKSTVIFLIIVILLVIGITALGTAYFIQERKITVLEDTVGLCNNYGKIVNFEKLFIEKVLASNGAVSYEDRLKLETAVVDTKDEDIIAQWQKFLASTNEQEAQQGVVGLLKLFSAKLNY